MSTQYDDIQAPYDYIRTRSIALIERENVHSIVAPHIAGARVLELACGSGFYTSSFLAWGAKAVVGVDISSVMITEAQRQGQDVSFIQADCSKPTSYPGGPFDIVFGAWLLNYAPDRAGLVDMFRNVALNLRDGGRFVSITPPPAQDPNESIDAEREARPPPEGSGCLVYSRIKDVDDGVYFRVHGETPVGAVRFECYHLRRDIYELAAREAGLKVVDWGVTTVPERYFGGNEPGGASLKELETYRTVPNYGLLVLTK